MRPTVNRHGKEGLLYSFDIQHSRDFRFPLTTFSNGTLGIANLNENRVIRD